MVRKNTCRRLTAVLLSGCVAFGSVMPAVAAEVGYETETLLIEETSESEILLETAPESEGMSESEVQTETVPESEGISESEAQTEKAPGSEGMSESEVQTETAPGSEGMSESEMQTETVPESEETSESEVQTESEKMSKSEKRLNRVPLSVGKSEADKDNNTDIIATNVSNPKASGTGVPEDPFYTEEKYISSTKESTVVTTVNPQATIDGVVGTKTFPLSYGLNTITFSVTSADGTKTVYYKFDITRNKKTRPNNTIPNNTLYVTAASTADAADGKICGLNAAETYEYWFDGSTDRFTVSGVTEITGLTAGTYKIKYGETADTKPAGDLQAVKVTISVAERDTLPIKITYTGHEVTAPAAVSLGERVDFKIKMNSADEWVQKVTWKYVYQPSGGWGSSQELKTQFTGYAEKGGSRYYTGYFILDKTSVKDRYVELTGVTTSTATYYTIGSERPQNASVKVTPANSNDAILVNGEYRYKKGSTVTIHVEANQSFGTSKLIGFKVYNETGEVIKESIDGSDLTLTADGNYVVKDIVIEMIPADFTEMEEQLARLDGVDLFVYKDDTRVAVEYKVELSKQMYKLTQKDQDYLDSFVAELKAAIDNLIPKPGDFTEANEVLAKIPSDLDSGIYTEQTVQTVQEAKKAVDTAISEGWNRLRQAEIDALTETLQKALDGLKKKLADYSAILKAKELIPSQLDIYTEESVLTLSNALVAIEENLDITQQARVDAMAQTLLDAINGLVKKPADYTAVEEAKEKVPSDLSVYTDETVKVLEDALAAVEEGLDITQQDKIDAMAQSILDAIEQLEEKKTETEKETGSESKPEAQKDDKGSSQNSLTPSNKNTGAVKTGDETNFVIWGIMCLASAGILLSLLNRKRADKN